MSNESYEYMSGYSRELSIESMSVHSRELSVNSLYMEYMSVRISLPKFWESCYIIDNSFF